MSPVRLQEALFPTHAVEFGTRTRWREGCLEIDGDELRALLAKDAALERVECHLARPGADQRIIHVLDAIEPRVKVEGPGAIFPGHLTPPETVGSGRTHVLQGVAVLTAAELPWRGGGLRTPREAVIDMRGPGAPYSPFSHTWNLVLELTLAVGRDDTEYDDAVRRAGLRSAAYLAEATRQLQPPSVDTWELAPCVGSLPRIVYIHQVQSQGTFGHTYLYGRDMDQLVPTLIHPNELLDGAVVSGNFLYPCFKTPTYLHCNLPVVRELYAGHGKEHCFAGVILSRGHYYTLPEKQRVAQYAAKLARLVGAAGAVITWEGGGNSIVEAMLTIQACERMGIQVSAIAYELGGVDGRQPLLIDSVPEAKYLVAAGSIEKELHLPPVTEVLGGQTLRLQPELGGRRYPAHQAITFFPIHEIYCGANQTGFGRVMAAAF